MKEKTHYRKVFKSEHLGIADLEDLVEEKKRLVFTIKEVIQYTLSNEKNSGVVVAGKRISANIAYFKEDIKPLVLNATNSKIVKSFAPNKSPFVEDWKSITIELYIDYGVKMKGDVVGGVRIKPKQPTLAKPELLPTNTKIWDAAVAHLKKGGNISVITDRYKISEENLKQLKDA